MHAILWRDLSQSGAVAELYWALTLCFSVANSLWWPWQVLGAFIFCLCFQLPAFSLQGSTWVGYSPVACCRVFFVFCFILGCRVGVGDLLELESLIHILVVSSGSQGVSFWGSRGSEMLWCLCGALVCLTDPWSAPARIVLLCRQRAELIKLETLAMCLSGK